MKTWKTILVLSAFTLLISSCSQKPADIHYGSDECVHCKMMIHDNRFASQIVTETGNSLKFDAIECMAAYAGNNKPEIDEARFYFSDFNNPGNWIDLQEVTIIKSEIIKSPMGASLLALGNDVIAEQHLGEYPGERVEWESLLK